MKKGRSIEVTQYNQKLFISEKVNKMKNFIYSIFLK